MGRDSSLPAGLLPYFSPARELDAQELEEDGYDPPGEHILATLTMALDQAPSLPPLNGSEHPSCHSPVRAEL